MEKYCEQVWENCQSDDVGTIDIGAERFLIFNWCYSSKKLHLLTWYGQIVEIM